MATLPGGSCWSFCCCAAVLGVITLKPEATSMLSLFWVLLVVAQPAVNANRDMTLIMLTESRTCFMILGSFQIALFLICHRWPLASTRALGSPLYPSKLMPSDTHCCPRASCRTMGLWSYYAPHCSDTLAYAQKHVALGDKCRTTPFWGFLNRQQQLRDDELINH